MSTEEIKINSYIDAAFIEKVEDQIYQILLTQRQAFNQRWQQHSTMNKVKTGLRYLGLLMCLAGTLVLITALIMKPNWSLKEWQVYLYLLFFVFAAWVLFKLPKLETAVWRWTEKTNQKSCKKITMKCVKQAKGMLPFSAQYEIKGDLISYYRNQQITTDDEGQWQFIWNRKMSRYAVQSVLTTVFFKKPKSIIPQIIVLHECPDGLKNIMVKHGITAVEIPNGQ